MSEQDWAVTAVVAFILAMVGAPALGAFLIVCGVGASLMDRRSGRERRKAGRRRRS